LKGQNEIFELFVNSITTSRVEFAVIGAQLFSSMIATFLQRHSFIQLHGPNSFEFLVNIFGIFCKADLFVSHEYEFGTCGNSTHLKKNATPLMTPTTALGLSICLSMFELRETGDWDIFLGPPERAMAETGGADHQIPTISFQ